MNGKRRITHLVRDLIYVGLLALFGRVGDWIQMGHSTDADSLWILSCTAPPKGLDDDEFEYIKELESKKNDVEQQRQAQHKEDLADFRTHFEIL